MKKTGELCLTCVFEWGRNCKKGCKGCSQAEVDGIIYNCLCINIGYEEDCPYYVLAEQETEDEG